MYVDVSALVKSKGSLILALTSVGPELIPVSRQSARR